MFKHYFNHATQLIMIINHEGFVIETNDAVSQLTGLDKSTIVGHLVWELPCWLHSDMMQNMVLFGMEQSAIMMENARFAAKYRDYKEDIIDVDFVIKSVFTEDEQIDYFVALGYNITELVSARKALSDSERQMNALFGNAHEGFLFNMLPNPITWQASKELDIIQDLIAFQKVVKVNSAFKAILGIVDQDVSPNSYVYQLLSITPQNYIDILETMIKEGTARLEHSFVNKQNARKTVEILFSLIRNDDLIYGNFCIIRDLTLQRQYEAKLKFYAFSDFLTGLNNRRTFFDLAEKAILNKRFGGVAMFDIDHFKSVNDTYGHDTGDIVLKNFAAAFANHFDNRGITARLGGEEFVVLLYHDDQRTALKALNSFREAYAKMSHTATDGQTLCSTVSIGYVHGQKVTPSITEALKQADIALYQAKTTGRNRIVVYSPDGDA